MRKMNRKSLNPLLLLLLISWVVSSCTKESIEPLQNTEITQPETPIQFNPQIENGVMVFESNEDFVRTSNAFASMSPQERISWGEANAFKTLQILMDEISAAEDLFDARYFAGLDPEMSGEELKAIGKPIDFSDLYKTSLQKGIIKQTEDPEYGGYGFELDIFDQSGVSVANELGMVVVDGQLLQYTKDAIKMMPYTDAEDIAKLAKATVSVDNIVVSNLDHGTKGLTTFINGNIWTQTGVVWYYDSSNHRFKHFVYFYSNSGTTAMSCSFYTESIAERKLFGKWKIRNSYNPIRSVSGSWSYYWRKYNSTTGLATYEWNNLGGGTPSPFSYSTSGSNHIKFYLNPTGGYALSSPYSFYHEARMSSYNIYGTFVGTTGSYSTHYHN